MTKPAGESCRWHVSQSRLGALLMPQGKCRRQGLWPRPHCVPPDPGRPSLGGDAVQGGQQFIVEPWIRKGPQTLLSLQRSPCPSGTPPPWGGSFRRPPAQIPNRTPRPAVHPQAFLWPATAAGNKSGKTISRWRCERCARDQAEREEERPHAHRLCLRGVSHRPHLHLLELEVLLGRQLRAAVRGARGLGLAVSFPEINVDPQPKVTVLSAHALQREAHQTARPTPALRPQGRVEVNAAFFFLTVK